MGAKDHAWGTTAASAMTLAAERERAIMVVSESQLLLSSAMHRRARDSVRDLQMDNAVYSFFRNSPVMVVFLYLAGLQMPNVDL